MIGGHVLETVTMTVGLCCLRNLRHGCTSARPMTIQEVLRVNHEALLEQYHTNAEVVSSLQAVLLRDILPSLRDELELGPDTTEWAKEWLCDTCTYQLIMQDKRSS
jgi:hypothetical protein